MSAAPQGVQLPLHAASDRGKQQMSSGDGGGVPGGVSSNSSGGYAPAVSASTSHSTATYGGGSQYSYGSSMPAAGGQLPAQQHPGAYGPSSNGSGPAPGGVAYTAGGLPPSAGPYMSSSVGMCGMPALYMGGLSTPWPSGSMLSYQQQQLWQQQAAMAAAASASNGGLQPPLIHAMSAFPGGMPPPPMSAMPLQHSGPTSSPGMLGVPGSVGPLPDDIAGARAAMLTGAAVAGAGAGAGAGVGVPALARPPLADGLSCTCPMVCMVGVHQAALHAVPLEIMSLQYSAACHISQAFVDLQLLCNYPLSWQDAHLMFFLPKTTDTVITELSIENLVRPTVYATTVVPMEDAQRLERRGGGTADGHKGDMATTDPELFVLPMPPGAPGDQYRINVSYFHPMPFDASCGTYVLQLPTEMPQVCLRDGCSTNSVLEVSVTINTDRDGPINLTVPSHPYAVLDSQPRTISLELDRNKAWPNKDVLLGFSVWRDTLTATVHVEPPQPEQADPRGTFALSITPPGPEDCVAFPRSVVFMFDRSASMTGDPIRFAKAALLTGLQSLTPADRFTVVAFDDEQMWWTDKLIEATPQNIVTCMQWVNDDLSARGTTDISGPLQRALRMLVGAPGLPSVFLITDGCVDGERDICKTAEAMIRSVAESAQAQAARSTASAPTSGNAAASDTLRHSSQQQQQLQQPSSYGTAASCTTLDGDASSLGLPSSGLPTSAGMSSTNSGGSSGGRLLAPRIYTFAIGPYCNHYFLKLLAALGRGLSDVAFRPHAIRAVMERMLAAAALPVLSDVTLCVQGLRDLQLYPFPIPDVFVGGPLLVSGKFEGEWPEQSEVRGIMADETSWVQATPKLPAGVLPLDKVFAKSRLDYMVADAWLKDNPPAMVERIVGASMASGITTPFTARLGFETTPEKYAQFKASSPDERRKRVAKWAIGGVAGVAVVAGVAAALAFGDVASTVANMPVGDIMANSGGLQDFVSAMADGGCDCCGGGCDCCGDCGDLCMACVPS